MSCGTLGVWDKLSVLPKNGGVITVGEGVGVTLLTTATVAEVPVPPLGVNVNTMVYCGWSV